MNRKILFLLRTEMFSAVSMVAL